MKKIIKRVTAFAVIFAFLYSNIVSAGGLPCDKLSSDQKAVLTYLISRTASAADDLEMIVAQANGIDAIRQNPSVFFLDLIERARNTGSGDKIFLSSIVKILLTVFKSVPNMPGAKGKYSVEFCSNGIILKKGKQKYTIILQGGEIKVTKGNAKKSARKRPLVGWLLTVLLLTMPFSVSAEEPVPAGDIVTPLFSDTVGQLPAASLTPVSEAITYRMKCIGDSESGECTTGVNFTNVSINDRISLSLTAVDGDRIPLWSTFDLAITYDDNGSPASQMLQAGMSLNGIVELSVEAKAILRQYDAKMTGLSLVINGTLSGIQNMNLNVTVQKDIGTELQAQDKEGRKWYYDANSGLYICPVDMVIFPGDTVTVKGVPVESVAFYGSLYERLDTSGESFSVTEPVYASYIVVRGDQGFNPAKVSIQEKVSRDSFEEVIRNYVETGDKIVLERASEQTLNEIVKDGRMGDVLTAIGKARTAGGNTADYKKLKTAVKRILESRKAALKHSGYKRLLPNETPVIPTTAVNTESPWQVAEEAPAPEPQIGLDTPVEEAKPTVPVQEGLPTREGQIVQAPPEQRQTIAEEEPPEQEIPEEELSEEELPAPDKENPYVAPVDGSIEIPPPVIQEAPAQVVPEEAPAKAEQAQVVSSPNGYLLTETVTYLPEINGSYYTLNGVNFPLLRQDGRVTMTVNATNEAMPEDDSDNEKPPVFNLALLLKDGRVVVIGQDLGFNTAFVISTEKVLEHRDDLSGIVIIPSASSNVSNVTVDFSTQDTAEKVGTGSDGNEWYYVDSVGYLGTMDLVLNAGDAVSMNIPEDYSVVLLGSLSESIPYERKGGNLTPSVEKPVHIRGILYVGPRDGKGPSKYKAKIIKAKKNSTDKVFALINTGKGSGVRDIIADASDEALAEISVMGLAEMAVRLKVVLDITAQTIKSYANDEIARRSQKDGVVSYSIDAQPAGNTGPKAFYGNVFPEIGALGEVIWESHRGSLHRDEGSLFSFCERKVSFYYFENRRESGKEMLYPQVEGKKYKLASEEGSAYFEVEDSTGAAYEVYGLTLARDFDYETGILIPKKLYEILKGNEEAKEQMAVHEWFERANEEDRLKYLNEVYGKFTEQIDREYFLALFRNAGVELSVESGKVNGIELLSENTRANFGHIGGEILELVHEYFASREGKKYARLEDVSVSSLDALILAVRLQEILGNDEISIDDFVEAITKPNNTDSLVISMIDGSGKIDFSRVSRAANAVSEASGGVTAFSQEEVATKATLVIGSQWKWIERRAQEVSEIISDRAMLGTIQGALWTNYSLEEADANKFLLSIRKELGRSAVLKDGRLSLSNPYIHAVIANIAGISGVQTQALLKEFYSDLVEGSGVGIIDAAVMNALVEIGMTGRKGISFFEPFVSERFASTVQGMGMIVSGPDAAFLKAPSGSRKEVAHSL